MRQHLELGEVEVALAIYRKSSRSASRWQPPERDWRDLIEALLKEDLWENAAQVMRDYVRSQAEPSPRIRLKLAQVLIQKLGRPLQGLRLLGQFPEGSLPEYARDDPSQLARTGRGDAGGWSPGARGRALVKVATSPGARRAIRAEGRSGSFPGSR